MWKCIIVSVLIPPSAHFQISIHFHTHLPPFHSSAGLDALFHRCSTLGGSIDQCYCITELPVISISSIGSASRASSYDTPAISQDSVVSRPVIQEYICMWSASIVSKELHSIDKYPHNLSLTN